MRLSERERQAIVEAIRRHFGPEARPILFGSRVDDTRRGGDIDLYVDTPLPSAEANLAKLSAIADIQVAIGERKIDLVISPYVDPNARIMREIEANGIPL